MAISNAFGKRILLVSPTKTLELNLKEQLVLLNATQNNFVLPRPVDIQDQIPRPTYWRIIQSLLKKEIIEEVEE